MANFNDANNGKWDASDADTWGAGVGVYPGSGDNVTIDSHTVTVSSSAYCTNLTQTGGTLAGAASISASGNISLTAGASSWTGTLVAWGTGKTIAIAFALASRLNLIGAYTAAGSVCALTLAGTGSLDGTGHNFYLYTPPANDYWTYTGTFTVGSDVRITGATGRSNAANINTGTAVLRISSNVGQTWSFPGGINCGAFGPTPYSAGTVIVDMAGGQLRAGAVTLGAAAQNTYIVDLRLGGTVHTIASLANAAAAVHLVKLQSCHLEVSGTANFSSMTAFATADNLVHIYCTGTGEITNFDPAQIVHVHGDPTVDGGGNNTVNNKTTFNTQAMPWCD